MKKSLSQAVALATLLGASVAVQAAPAVEIGGLGEALIYPLYTVDNNNTTILTVTNTTDEYKAVKVRFLEGMNSAEVLDFHLYLSPYDVWNGNIVPTEDGAKLMSNDTSCIVGLSNGFPKDGIEFRTSEISKDGDSKDVPYKQRTRVGHFEVIEMGVVDPDQALGSTTAGKAIKHVNGTPGNCAAVTAAWNPGGVWHDEIEALGAGTVAGILAKPNSNLAPTSAVTGVNNPTGGLYGQAAIVNIADSTATTYDATALTGLYTNAQHPYPGTIFPHLLSGVDAKIGTDGYAAAPADNVVATALLKASLNNDYYVDPAVGAQTDFVITYPTKRFHVNGTGAPTSPFTNAWSKKELVSSDSIAVTYYDQEEAFDSVELEHISPLPDNVTSNALNWETNIFGINGSDIYGGDQVRTNFELANGFTAGWMAVELGANGLPVVGFSAITTKNGVSAEGVVKNFGQTFSHKYTK